MRVLMTTDTVGGVWTFTQELTAGLLGEGCSIALVSLGRMPSDGQERWVASIQSDWGERFRFVGTEIPLEWMQANGPAFEDAAPLLLQLARDFRADVLHLNQMCFGAVATILPKVVTAHSDVLSWAKACRDGEMEDSAWLRQYRALVNRGLAEVDVVTAPTRWMLGVLAEHYRLPLDRRVIPNGRYLKAAKGKKRAIQAVTAGRMWDEAKNVAMLEEVSSPIPLLVAGEASQDGASMRATTGTIKLLGWLTETELLALYRSSALYICPSKYEPFGLAALEAALCGCAVLANDIPSLREVWQDGALYFSDASSLSELLHTLHGHPELLARAQMRSSARARVLSREKMTSAYLAVFEDVVERSRAMANVA